MGATFGIFLNWQKMGPSKNQRTVWLQLVIKWNVRLVFGPNLASLRAFSTID